MGDCIVDANILQASGYSQSLDSIKCRELLELFDNLNHVVLCSSAIWAEWQQHLSKYALMWQSRMVASQRIVFGEPSNYHKMGIAAAIKALPIAQQPAAVKDAHLLEMAVSGNAIVMSCEIVCRGHFVRAGAHYAPITGVYWVSPLTCPIVHGWLRNPTAPPLGWLLV